MALEMDQNDLVEIFLGHVPDHPLAQHAGHVDHEIDAAEAVHALPDHAPGLVVFRHRVIVGNGLAPGGGNLGHHFIRRPLVRILAAPADARIIDNDIGAFPGQQQRHIAPDAPARAGDDA